MNYVKDGAAIYRESFSIIRREADLSAFQTDLARVVVRMIHACGMTDLPQDVQASPDAASAGVNALLAGAPLFCDATMVANGITRSRLPRNNEVICTLSDARTPELAAKLHTTRSAAAVELWRDRLAGSVVVIGNAPTALFHLLDMLEAETPDRAQPCAHHRHSCRICRCGRIQGSTCRQSAWNTLPDGSRTPRRERHCRGSSQCARE